MDSERRFLLVIQISKKELKKMNLQNIFCVNALSLPVKYQNISTSWHSGQLAALNNLG